MLVSFCTILVINYVNVGREVIGRSYCLRDATYSDYLFSVALSAFLPCIIQSLLLIIFSSKLRSRTVLAIFYVLTFPAACIMSSYWICEDYCCFFGTTWSPDEILLCFVLGKPWTFPLLVAGYFILLYMSSIVIDKGQAATSSIKTY
jgi:hypothetical protein